MVSERRKQHRRNSAHKARERLKQRILNYKLIHPCVDCGEQNPTVLEFDHVRGIKRYKLNYMRKAGHSWKRVLEEIAKCEVRCKKCHNLRHYPQQSYKRISTK